MRKAIIGAVLTGLLVMPSVYAASGGKKIAHKKTNAPSSRKSAAPQASDDWHAAPDTLSQLGEGVQVDNYSVLLPLGYNEVSLPPALVADQEKKGFDNHLYATGRRADGTHGGLVLTVATPLPDMGGTLSLDEALQGAVAQKKHDWQDFVESKPETGRVGSLAFERVYFKGTYSDASVTRQAHGFAYVTEDGGRVISMIAEDAEPHNEVTLPVDEAAVLTFHRH